MSALLLLLGAGRARADDAAEAKTHYQKATAHFAVGEYREAAAEYEAAFKLKQDPALLYDAAQAHRLGGDNQKALLLYRNLVKLYPGSPYSGEAQERITKLEQAPITTPASPTAETPPAAPSAAIPPPPSAAIPPPPSAPPPPPTAAPPVLISTTPASPAAQPAPIYKRWWFWAAAGAVAVGAVVVAVAASGSAGAWATNPDVHGAPAP